MHNRTRSYVTLPHFTIQNLYFTNPMAPLSCPTYLRKIIGYTYTLHHYTLQIHYNTKEFLTTPMPTTQNFTGLFVASTVFLSISTHIVLLLFYFLPHKISICAISLLGRYLTASSFHSAY